MSQKIHVYGFEQVKNSSQFSKDFIGNYNGDSDEGYFLEADVQFPEEQHTLHNNLSFLSKRMKIGKVEKLLAALYYLKGYVIKKKKPFKKFWIKSWVSI